MGKVEQHEELMKKIHETYIQKNRAYGNSFDKSCDDFGVTAAMVRMSDKWNRLRTLTQNNDIPIGDESVKDTLLDLANYCIMTYMWLDETESREKFDPINWTSEDVNIHKTY